MSVKGHKRHREVRVVCHFTNRVNQLNLILQAVKVRELELRDSEEVGSLFHGGLKLFKLGPKVVKLAPISLKVHLGVEFSKKVVELL